MARYSVTSNKAGVNTANTIMWQLRPVTNRSYLLELGLSVAVAPTTGPEFILSRSLTLGTASGTPVVPQIEGSLGKAATLLLDTAWSVAPTTATIPMRRYAVPNAIGSGVVWTWYDKPLEIDLGATFAIQIINGNATGATLGNLDIYAVIDE
jgi:hypothetical protein